MKLSCSDIRLCVPCVCSSASAFPACPGCSLLKPVPWMQFPFHLQGHACFKCGDKHFVVPPSFEYYRLRRFNFTALSSRWMSCPFNGRSTEVTN